MFFDKKKSKYALVRLYPSMYSGVRCYQIIEYDEAKVETLDSVMLYLNGEYKQSVCTENICGFNYRTIEDAKARRDILSINDTCSCDGQCGNKPEDKVMYVVTGEYPNLAISAKYIEAEDEFNFCFSESDTDNLSLHPKDRCFDTYEQANNKVIELIQKATSTKKK